MKRDIYIHLQNRHMTSLLVSMDVHYRAHIRLCELKWMRHVCLLERELNVLCIRLVLWGSYFLKNFFPNVLCPLLIFAFLCIIRPNLHPSFPYSCKMYNALTSILSSILFVSSPNPFFPVMEHLHVITLEININLPWQ